MNFALLTLMALVGLSIKIMITRLGFGWLYAAIVANLIFISIFGAKLIAVFGFTTNVGNIFYAMVFFATYLLIEHYGKEVAQRSIWIGAFGVVLLIIASQFVISLTSESGSMAASRAIETLFGIVPRVALASLTAYTIAQHVNIWLYVKMRERMHGKKVFARMTVAILIAQLVDSVIFFLIAFAGVLPMNILLQTLVLGYAIKVLIGILSIPFMYLSLGMRTA